MFIGCIGHFRTACKNFNKLRAQLGTYEDLKPPPPAVWSPVWVYILKLLQQIETLRAKYS